MHSTLFALASVTKEDTSQGVQHLSTLRLALGDQGQNTRKVIFALNEVTSQEHRPSLDSLARFMPKWKLLVLFWQLCLLLTQHSFFNKNSKPFY